MLTPAEAASAKGGSKDDFSIFSIVVGNESVSPNNGFNQMVQ